MASVALQRWQGRREGLLNTLDAECVTTATAVPLDPVRADLAVRAFVVQLAAQFQGFARELYDEGVTAVVAVAPPAVQTLVQKQCFTRRELLGANGRYDAIRADFERFDLNLKTELTARTTVVVIDRWVTDLTHLNAWRNYVAHDNPFPPAHGGPLSLATVRGWRVTRVEFAVVLDAVLYDHLMGRTGVAPW